MDPLVNPNHHRNTNMELTTLPVDVLSLLLDQLSQRDLKKLRSACRSLHQLIRIRISRIFLSPNRTNIDAFRGIAATEIQNKAAKAARKLIKIRSFHGVLPPPLSNGPKPPISFSSASNGGSSLHDRLVRTPSVIEQASQAVSQAL